MPKLNLACAQIECVPGDVAANLGKHLAFIGKARAQGIDLLVFPELSLTDYLSVPDTRRLKRRPDAPEIMAIAAAARPMAVSFGFIEAAEDGGCYNAQALVHEGRLVHVHRKLNLPTYGNLQEGLHYRQGERLTLATITDNVTAATLICADSWNPALAWLAALQLPDLLIQPVASARSAVGGDFDNPSSWATNLRHSAMTYGTPVVMVNHCGTRNGLDFWGGSRILDAYGREVAQAGGEETLVHAQIDTADSHAARLLLPTVRDADPALVRAELERLLGAGVRG